MLARSVTRICNVHGYILEDSQRRPTEGRLFYRGIDALRDIVKGCTARGSLFCGSRRWSWLPALGYLPTAEQLSGFTRLSRAAPRAARGLYRGYDHQGAVSEYYEQARQEACWRCTATTSWRRTCRWKISFASPLNSLRAFRQLSVNAYQVKKRYYDHESLFFHSPIDGMSFSENILSTLRFDRQFTRKEEAKLLDICLILHAGRWRRRSKFHVRLPRVLPVRIHMRLLLRQAIGDLKGKSQWRREHQGDADARRDEDRHSGQRRR